MQTFIEFTVWNRLLVYQMQILYSEEEAGTQFGINTHVVKKNPINSGLSIS